MDETTNQPAPSSGSNKKVLYIVIAVVALFLLGGFAMQMMGLAAMRAAGVNVMPGADGSATYTATNGEGTVTVGGNKMPDNWPSDAPANFSGATIQYSGSSNPQTGKEGAAVAYTVQASASAVADYYKSQLTSKGWTVDSTANMGAATVLSAQKDERTIGIYIADAGNGTVQVTVGMDMQ
jgi:hypothetical protein